MAKSSRVSSVLIAVAMCVVSGGASAFDLDSIVGRFSKKMESEVASDVIILRFVQDQNSKNRSLDEIKRLDQEWINTAHSSELIRSVTTNLCASQLRQIKSTFPYLVELFVMDQKGALVCASDKTSDYWQGDESKFTRSYNQGKGGQFLDDPEYDESVQAFTVQYSASIQDESGVIGAVTFGIDLDLIFERELK